MIVKLLSASKIKENQLIRSISETLAKINDMPKKEQAAHLYACGPILRDFLRWAFKPPHKFLLPEGVMEFPTPTDNDDATRASTLIQHVRKFYMYTDDPQAVNMKQEKRERLFKEFLHQLTPEDANLVLAVKDGKLPYPKITKKLCEEAWPEF